MALIDNHQPSYCSDCSLDIALKSSHPGLIRVLHVITGTAVGGAERMLHKLATRFDRNLFETIVVSLTTKGLMGELLEANGVPVIALNASGYLGMVAVLPRLVAILKKYNPHLVQGWMYHGNVAASAAVWLGRRPLPVLWNVRYSLDNLKHEKRLTAATIYLGVPFSRLSSRVLYNSAVSAKQHEEIGYPVEKTAVISNGFDTNMFKPSNVLRTKARKELGVEGDEVLVGMVAQFRPHKMHAYFLETAAICAKKLGNVRFVLVGRGVDNANKEITALISKFELDDIVSLKGERDDIHQLLPALDAHVLSSAAEGFPNVMGEAMACGIPCVATDVGDCAWVAGETGRIVPPHRPDLLAQALIEILEEPQPAKEERSRQARQRIENLFSLDAIAGKYQRLYRSVVENFSAQERG